MKFGNTNYRYVVIDDFDKSGTINGQEDNWITVNPHFGLTAVNAIEAIIILNDTAPIPIDIARQDDEMTMTAPVQSTIRRRFCTVPLSKRCPYCAGSK